MSFKLLIDKLTGKDKKKDKKKDKAPKGDKKPKGTRKADELANSKGSLANRLRDKRMKDRATLDSVMKDIEKQRKGK